MEDAPVAGCDFTPHEQPTRIGAAHRDGSASDVSMREDSDGEGSGTASVMENDPEQLHPAADTVTGLDTPGRLGKPAHPSMETTSETSFFNAPAIHSSTATEKGLQNELDIPTIPSDSSPFPPEIWHHIFTFTTPKSLGKLLRVNRLFNGYLLRQPSSVEHIPSLASRGALSRLQPNAIWRASRRLFWPRMPGPLRDHSEVDMWRLICSQSCQLCGQKAQGQADLRDPWHAGPGSAGLATIFPFAITSCGPCLLKTTVKVSPAEANDLRAIANRPLGNRHPSLFIHPIGNPPGAAVCHPHERTPCCSPIHHPGPTAPSPDPGDKGLLHCPRRQHAKRI